MSKHTCMMCRYSSLDFHDKDCVFLRDVYCTKGHITDYHISYDELEDWDCPDYKVSIINWLLSHILHFMVILLALILLHMILSIMEVI